MSDNDVVDLHEMVENFITMWGPPLPSRHRMFVASLRVLLEAYGRAALTHESLPDTEHGHGEPV
jgi:hypothetical protein